MRLLSRERLIVPINGLAIIRLLRCFRGRHCGHAGSFSVIVAINIAAGLGFSCPGILLEHVPYLFLEAVGILPDLCQLSSGEIGQEMESGDTVIILAVVHLLQADLHQAAVGRTPAEAEGLADEEQRGVALSSYSLPSGQ